MQYGSLKRFFSKELVGMPTLHFCRLLVMLSAAQHLVFRDALVAFVPQNDKLVVGAKWNSIGVNWNFLPFVPPSPKVKKG